MFEWLKAKRPQEAEAVSAAPRVDPTVAQMSAVRNAAAAIGVAVPLEMPEDSVAGTVAAGFVQQILDIGGFAMNDEDTEYTVGIFLFAAANHLSRLISANFELSTVFAAFKMIPDPQKGGRLLFEAGENYNQMSRSSEKVMLAIGQNVAKWVANPTKENLLRLTALFKLCKESLA